MTAPIAWTARLGAFVAIGTSPAALMLGGAAGRGTDGLELVAGLVVGIVAVTALVGAQGALGPGRGELSEVLAGPLGRRGGARIASVAMLLMMLGWFGVNAGAGGAGAALLLGLLAGVSQGLLDGVGLILVDGPVGDEPGEHVGEPAARPVARRGHRLGDARGGPPREVRATRHARVRGAERRLTLPVSTGITVPVM